MGSFWRQNVNESGERIPCPNCGAPLLANMKECPKCHYSLVNQTISASAQQRLYDQQFIQNVEYSFVISTNSHPVGYSIVEERGIVFGDCLYTLPESIANARQEALNAIKSEAIARQCNAVLGLRVETSMIGTMYCITVYGTATRILKLGNEPSV